MVKVERWDKARQEWVRVAEYPDDQRSTAEEYAKDRAHTTGRRYRTN